MSENAMVPFDLTGEYGGFIFTEEGKRRMRLRVGEREYLLKVPRELRRRAVAKFRPPQTIRVVGHEEAHEPGRSSKWVVADFRTLGVEEPAVRTPKPASPGPIRICSKKNCWRKGGGEIFDYLQHQSAARGLDDTLSIKPVGCMDHCKHAPNLEWQGRTYQRCTLAQAKAILDHVEAVVRSAVPANGAET